MTDHDRRAEARSMRVARLAGWLTLVAAALWLRVSNHDQVFAYGSVLPLTADATYHLHRSLAVWRSFPHAAVFDPLMNWPHGAYSHVADGYDMISALVARVLVAGDDERRVAAVMVYVPVAFGLATAWVALRIARRLSRPAERGLTSAIAALLALLLPIALFVSLLGRTDHHCAEALCAALLCLWALARFPLADFAAQPRARRIRFELAGAGLVALTAYLFNGAPVYVALVVPVMMGAVLADRAPAGDARPRWFGSGAPALALGAIAAAALYAPALSQHGRAFSYAYPSLLQPLVMLAMASACAAAVLVAAAVRFGDAERVPARRILVLAAAGAMLLGAGACVPALREPVVAAVTEHLLRKEPWLQVVVEAEPLFAAGPIWTRRGWDRALQYFGVFAPLSLALLPLAVRHAARVSRGRAAVLAWFAGALLALALAQNRFARSLYPLLSVWSALGAAALASALGRGGSPERVTSGRRILGAALIAAALLGVAATQGFASRVLPRDASAVEPPQLVSLFLAAHNPVRKDGTRAGALAPWSLGHNLMWPARTGVVANGFLFHAGREILARSQAALAGREREVLALMQERDLRWLVTGAAYYQSALAGPSRVAALLAGEHGPVVNAAYLERVPLATSILGGGGLPSRGVPHLARLAPRFAAGAAGLPLPAYWVFERVPGAVLAGAAAPGARVVAELALEAGGGRFPYLAWTDAGPDGRFALRVPLWSGARGEFVHTAGAYRLTRPGAPPRDVTVGEQDVRAGREIAIP